jgi:HAD superfamily hydrolase (TIGR01509 family)
MSMSIQAVIWDLGGVLVRTEDRGPRSTLGQQFGRSYEEMDALVFDSETAKLAGLGVLSAAEHWQQVCRGLPADPAELQAVEAAFWGGDRLDEGLIAFIRSLRPRARTGLLSNAWSNLREALDQRWGILDAFDEVIISAEVGLAKPDPRIYRLAVERLGVQPERAAFVDDVLVNVEAARRVGLHGVHFRSAAQAQADVEAWLAKG